ncbi:MAG: hypothetical protein ACYTHN_09510 [Planctomycetota bacterium]
MNEERLDRLLTACRNVHGPAYAERCREAVEEDGHLNYAQLVYGLHYCADEMPQDNEMFLQWVEEAGFGWFRKFQSSEMEPL